MFDETQRQIFTYFNGVKEVKGDPLTIHRKLTMTARIEGHDFVQLIENVTRLPAVAKTKKKVDIDVENATLRSHHEATDSLLGLIRTAFNVKAVEDDGLTEQETMKLLADFMVYLSDLKKNIESLPNSSPSTDSRQWEKPPVLPMNSSWDSGSIVVE